MMIFACALALVGLVAVAWFLLPMALRKLGERRLASICRKRRLIALTFDDGPGESLTAQILDLLEQYGAKATFFALGGRAAQRPEIVKLALARGHEVGSHTQQHLNAWKSGTLAMVSDIRRGIDTISDLGGLGEVYRPTFGKLTVPVLIWALGRRLKLSWWTIDTRDSWAPKSIEAVIEELKTKGGGVVLMHDFESYARLQESLQRDRTNYVTGLTTAILEMARSDGFVVVRMCDI